MKFYLTILAGGKSKRFGSNKALYQYKGISLLSHIIKQIPKLIHLPDILFISLHNKSQFQEKPKFPHGMKGIFVSQGAKIGYGCVIFQHVTIGSNTLPDSKGKGTPTIGNNCYIGAGAKIIGNVKIGQNCRIGANCVVVKDLSDNSLAVLPFPRVIEKNHLDNQFDSYI